MPHIVANALGGADPKKLAPITIWAHRGCVPFISQKTFNEIFWPTLKPVFEEIISKGYQILFYGEGSWEAHFDALREMPAGSIIFHIDKDDPARTAMKLKDRFALSGGMRYDVLARGTPADVRAHLKELFAVLKGDGGYILDCSALMLSDIDPENVRTAIEYTLEHGVYSQSSADKSSPGKKREVIVDPPVIPQGKRPPNTVRTWEEESANYRQLSGDIDLVRSSWQSVDAAAYNYAWTTVLW